MFEAEIVFEICWLQNLIMTLLNGHNSTKGDNPDLKKIWVSYFLMGNPSMKFQSPLLNFERTDGRQTSPKQYAPSIASDKAAFCIFTHCRNFMDLKMQLHSFLYIQKRNKNP